MANNTKQQYPVLDIPSGDGGLRVKGTFHVSNISVTQTGLKTLISMGLVPEGTTAIAREALAGIIRAMTNLATTDKAAASALNGNFNVTLLRSDAQDDLNRFVMMPHLSETHEILPLGTTVIDPVFSTLLGVDGAPMTVSQSEPKERVDDRTGVRSVTPPLNYYHIRVLDAADARPGRSRISCGGARLLAKMAAKDATEPAEDAA